MSPQEAREIAQMMDRVQFRDQGDTKLLANGISAIRALADQVEAVETATTYLTSAVEDIAAERRRQIEAEGWTPDHDDRHDHGDLAMAAAVYASYPRAPNFSVVGWPWSKEWFKPTTPRRNLIKAAALLVAEVERLDRAAARKD